MPLNEAVSWIAPLREGDNAWSDDEWATFFGMTVAQYRRSFMMTVDEWNEHMAAIRRAAFSNLSRQLLALCDDSTSHAIWELARFWQIEALR